MKNLEMRSKVNATVNVTQNDMHHSAIPRGIQTLIIFTGVVVQAHLTNKNSDVFF